VQTTPDAESTPAVSPADADGDVASERRRRHLVEAAAQEAGGLEVRDDLQVTCADPPATAEDLR